MMTPMTPGTPLSHDEAEHVEKCLLEAMADENLVKVRDGVRVLSMNPNDFLARLKWAQRRFPDVRDHLSSTTATVRLSRTVELMDSIFMSRSMLNVRFRDRRADPFPTKTTIKVPELNCEEAGAEFEIHDNGAVMLIAYNEGGHNCTTIDVRAMLMFMRDHPALKRLLDGGGATT